MKKSLAHLPEHKQDELKRITRIIRKQFPTARQVEHFCSAVYNSQFEKMLLNQREAHKIDETLEIAVQIKLGKGMTRKLESKTKSPVYRR
jgi:hypothetical protein